MPIYEFTCKTCRKPFEQLCRMGVDEDSVECPHCGAKGAERLISVFFSQSKDTCPSDCPLPASGACHGGACGCPRH